MANAQRDDNFIICILAVSLLDYATPVSVAVNPVTHAVICDVV